MGNKFRLSDMLPRAWLRKLKNSGSTALTKTTALPPPDGDRNRDHDHDQTQQRKSYHFSRQFDAVQPRHPPTNHRRSTNKHRRSALLRRPPSRPRRVSVAVSSGRSCRALDDFEQGCRFPSSTTGSLSSTDAVLPRSPPLIGNSSGSFPSSESFDQMASWTTTSSSCKCRAGADLDGSATLEEGFNRDPLFELELPAVIAKPPEFNEIVMNLRRQGENKKPIAATSRLNSTSAVSAKVVEEDPYNRTVGANKEQKHPRMIGNSSGSPARGMRLRVHSPKLAPRKSRNAAASFRPGMNLGSNARTSGVSNGFAVVKSSVDPWKDFRESMWEMIAASDISCSKDLEELLACYLILNSDEYHDLIVSVFKQIWFDFYGTRAR